MQELKALREVIRGILETAHSPRYAGQKSEIIGQANAAMEKINWMIEKGELATNPVLHFFNQVLGTK